MLTYFSKPETSSLWCFKCFSVSHTNKRRLSAVFRGLNVKHFTYAQVFQVFQNKIAELLNRQNWRLSAVFYDCGGETPCR